MNELLKKRIYNAITATAIAIAAAVGTEQAVRQDPLDQQAVAIAGELAKWYEGRRLIPYKDVVGVWTVCDGVTGKDVVLGKIYTPAECDKLLSKHLQDALDSSKRVIKTWGKLSMWPRAALIDFTYNFGEQKLATSTLALLFNNSQFALGCDQLQRWVNGNVKGKPTKLPGLVLRRADEDYICTETILNDDT